MTQWNEVLFGDVAENIKVKVQNVFDSKFDRYIAGEHMDSEDLKLNRFGTIGKDYLGPAFNIQFLKGQILYGSRRTYLKKIAVADFDGITSNTTFVIQPKENIIVPELLPFIMQLESFTKHSINNSKGSVNPYINWKDIAKYKFYLPDINEQERIVKILSNIEESIQNHKQLLERIIKYKKVFINENLSGYTENDNMKDQGKIKIKKIKELCEINPSKNSKTEIDDDYLVDFIAMEDVSNDAEIINIQKKKYSQVSKGFTNFKRNDILVAKITPCFENGKGALCSDLKSEIGFGSTEFHVLRVKNEEVIPEYIYINTITDRFRRLGEWNMTGSAGQKRVPREFIEQYKIVLPSIENQVKILETISKIDDVIRHLIKHIDNTKQLKNNLLYNLLDYKNI